MNTQIIEIAELRLQSVDIKNKHAAITVKRKHLEAELASLNARIRTAKTHKYRLNPEEYRSICNRQTVIKKRIAELETQAEPLKAKLREIAAHSAMCYAIGEEDGLSLTDTTPDNKMRIDIIELRGRWLAFAEDQTRVNSMRVMASQFSRELTDILSKYE